MKPIALAFALAFALGAHVVSAAPSPQELEFFESKVRPLLAEQCYRCHSTKAEKLKGGLLLDHGSTLLSGGDAGPVVAPGDPDKSLLVEAVRYKNPELQMPPKKRLSDDQIKVLEQWVALGAPWPDEPAPSAEKKPGPKSFDLAGRKAEHWCWQPVVMPPVPAVKDTWWSEDPIDRHILAKLEQKGLQPSEPAHKRLLIRRAYFDLIGLPPTPEQVDAFVADSEEGAFARVIDGLLASPHFGERWARHWMDLVRYAESCGHEFDYNIPHAPEYRNYLIRAFNADVPYDRFATEHIAGDLMDPPRYHPDDGYNESVIATGFWHMHEATHAPTDVRANEADRVDNQIDVFSKTFLSVTVSCARCHDHMFDAISTKDYYALAGYLQSSRRNEALLDPGKKIAKQLSEIKKLKAKADALLGDVFASGVEPESLARYLMAANEGVAEGANQEAIAKRYQIETGTLKGWVDLMVSEAVKKPEHPLYVWSKFIGLAPKAPAAEFTKRMQSAADELARHRDQHEKQAADKVQFADFGGATFHSLGWSTTGQAYGDGPVANAEWIQAAGRSAEPGRANGGRFGGRAQGVLRSPTFEITHNQIHTLAAAHKGGLSVRLIIDGYWMEPNNGLLFRGTRINDANTDGLDKWLTIGGDLRLHRGRRAHLEYIDHGDGFFDLDEIWFSDGGPPPVAPSATAMKVAGNEKITSLKELALAYGWLWKHAKTADPKALDEDARGFLAIAEGLGTGDARIAKLAGVQKEMAALANSVPHPRRVQALTDGSAENEFVFLRGSHKRLGDEVPRRFLTALGGENLTAPKSGSGRLDLARQVVSPANPLTARVITNRLWHHLFGRGLVASTDDFGVLGKRPTHPELLDHLAATFVEQDQWSIKRALKRMMLTKTYQQASVAGGRGDEIDPENLLLHRANLRRLQGEVIRDAMLAVSGRLDRKLYGGSVPVHLTNFMTGRGRPQGGPLDGQGRRSVYVSVRRNFLSPMMLAFDTPQPFSSMGRRTVSNVPAQALIMMNDPMVHEQAKLWGKRVAEQDLDPVATVRRMYQQAFGRAPDADELAAGTAYLGDSANAETLGEYAHVLFNTKEFIFLY